MTSGAPSRASADFTGMKMISSGARLALGLEPLVEIAADCLHQRIDLAVEEMISARDHVLLDHDALLRLGFLDEAAGVPERSHRILIAMHARDGPWARPAGRKT